MNRLGKFLLAASVVVLPMACKNETRKEADKAAENVKDQREDLKDESKDLKEAIKDQKENVHDYAKSDTDMTRSMNEKQVEHNAKEVGEESKEVSGAAKDVAVAEGEFDIKRHDRVSQLRLVHGVKASQPMLINAIAGATPLTDKARADLSEKMQTFQMRLDEAGNAIEALQSADASGFEDRNDAASEAMDKVEDARKDAWEALNDGDRIQPS